MQEHQIDGWTSTRAHAANIVLANDRDAYRIIRQAIDANFGKIGGRDMIDMAVRGQLVRLRSDLPEHALSFTSKEICEIADWWIARKAEDDLDDAAQV